MAYREICVIFVLIITINMKRIEYTENELVGNYGISYMNELPKQGEKRRALFKCSCGNEYQATITNVRGNKSTSCGCSIGEKHGMKHSKYYNLWRNIKERCYNKNNPRYKDYGGRGIIMNNEWIKSFTKFYNYIYLLENFDQYKLTLDRIDNDGNYDYSNLRWATYKQQRNNQRKKL